MTVRINVDFTFPRGRNPFTQGFSKRRALNEFAAKLHALAGGTGGGGVGDTRATMRVSTANATGTVTTAAVQSGDTVTVNGQALTATQHHARGTITCASADAADNVTIGATTFVGTAGAVTPGAATYSIDTGNNQAAASLAAQINAHPVASTIVTAVAASAVVTVRAKTAGTGGNSIVLTSTDGTDLAVSGSGTLTGGAAVANNQFDFGGSNDQTAAALAAAINATTTDIVELAVQASVASAVVTITAEQGGVGGNDVTLASSNGGRLAVTGARLTGGTETTYVF